jgi:hypothetical protein
MASEPRLAKPGTRAAEDYLTNDQHPPWPLEDSIPDLSNNLSQNMNYSLQLPG